MICNQCNKEYFGDFCPDCSAQNEPAPAPENLPPKSNCGVHSDTMPSSFATPPTPPQQPHQQQSQPPQQSQPSPQQPYRFCPQCGAELHGAFCGQCGFHVVSNPTPPPNPPQPAQPTSWNQSSNPQMPPYSVQQDPYQSPNAPPTSSFTQNYQWHQQRFPSKKTSPWVVALLVAYVLFALVVPSIFSALYSNNLASILDRYLNDFASGYSDDYPYFPDTEKDSNDFDDFDDFDDFFDEGDSIIPNGVSPKEYKQLKIGMTYAQVSYIIGGDAVAQDRADDDPNVTVAVWIGENNPDAVIRISFKNDAVVAIEQTGLR